MRYKGEYDPSFLLDPVSISFGNHQSIFKLLQGELFLVHDQNLHSIAREAQVCVLLGP